MATQNMSMAPQSGQNMSPIAQVPQKAPPPKLTPEKLMQFRQQGIGSSAVVKFYGSLNPEFKSRYESGIGKNYNFAGPDGQPLSWDDIALNMEAYGNPTGPVGMQAPQQQMPAPEQTGILGKIGKGAAAVWDYATSPVEAASDALVLGAAKVTGNEKVAKAAGENLKGNLQQTADIAPLVGGTIGSAAGPLGTGVGAGAGKAIGNFIEAGLDIVDGKEQRRGVGSKVAGPVGEGLLAYGGDKLFQGAGKAMPYFKKGLTKTGMVLTNVGDDVLERAFNKPRIVSDAIGEISENVKQPFLKLSQQIGNTMKKKIDEAGAKIGKIKDYIRQNNPGATYDVSAATDDLKKVLEQENLTLTIGSNPKGKKDYIILNSVGEPITSEAAINPSITGITQGQAKPLSDAEISGITEYIKTINKAEKYSIDDVLDLKKLYNRIYKELGTNDIGTTSNAQRILRRLRETADKKIADSMPTDLREAYTEFSDAIGAHEDFGSFLTDNKGKLELSDRAESYLNTLWGNTKGQRREDIEKLSEFLGIDINGKMQSLKDAQELSLAFPKTGGRTLDVLRTFMSKFAAVGGANIGLYLGNVPGAVVGAGLGATTTLATSPLVAGKVAINAGKLAGTRQFKNIVSLLKTIAPAEREALIMLLTGRNIGASDETPQSGSQTGTQPIVPQVLE